MDYGRGLGLKSIPLLWGMSFCPHYSSVIITPNLKTKYPPKLSVDAGVNGATEFVHSLVTFPNGWLSFYLCRLWGLGSLEEIPLVEGERRSIFYSLRVHEVLMRQSPRPSGTNGVG